MDMNRSHSLRQLYSHPSSSSSSSSLNNVTPKDQIRIRLRTGQDDTAAQAEFASKKWVWISDTHKGYVAAWVVSEDTEKDEYNVRLADDNTSRTVVDNDISRMNPPKFSKAEDIAELTHLNEASVIHNLRQRYESNLIYTYSGLFLVAINPYYPLNIYTSETIQEYQKCRREDNPPHVFAVAEQAWQNMVGDREGQSILITGESGAGKTENTKRVIQYLTAIAAESLPASGSANALNDWPNSFSSVSQQSKKSSLGKLESQIIEANPILESFGNAQTVRNNNSSRFGKFVRIEFTSGGSIAGATIDWYLLEKSRVTGRNENERSFHVFYQLLRSAPQKLKDSLLLSSSSPQDYGYLSLSRWKVDAIDDAEEWRHLQHALNIVGFSQEEQNNLYQALSAILHLGNVDVTEDSNKLARIKDTSSLEKAAHILGVGFDDLRRAFLEPRVRAGKEIIANSRSQAQVVAEMASLCRTLYEKNFGSIVTRINQALDRTSVNNTFIGVLDIAGFEIFDRNSFEQLCINYTNEKLQQFFNHHMFVLEQEEYAREEIAWDPVDFGQDLQPTIDLIETSKPVGILSCIDEESIMPRATDKSLTEKLNKLAKDNEWRKYIPGRFAEGFTLQHYAGNVEYETEGWLEKNKDPLNPDLTSVVSSSKNPYIASLFSEYAKDSTNNASQRTRVKKGAFRTVGQRHREQLSSLMKQLGATQPHFVRCIVPNSMKRAGKIDAPLVLHQLRCNGVLEGIRIARLGYPNRHSFMEFRQRYEILVSKALPVGYIDSRRAVSLMTEALDLSPTVYKIGLTKIFFKAGILADLEEKRDNLLFSIFSSIQASARRTIARRRFLKIVNRASAARVIQRNARIYNELKNWPWWQLYTKIKPLLVATRSDDDLKRKAAELAIAKERAERDKKEKERLDAFVLKLKSKQEELDKEVERFENQTDILNSKLEESMQAQTSLETELGDLKAEYNVVLEKMSRLELEKNKSDETAKTTLQRAVDAELELSRVSKLHGSVEEEMKQLDKKFQLSSKESEKLTKKKDDAYSELKKECDAIKKEMESNRKESLAERSSMKQIHDNSIRQKESTYIELQLKYEQLKQELESSKTEAHTTNSTLREVHENTLKRKDLMYSELKMEHSKALEEIKSIRKENHSNKTLLDKALADNLSLKNAHEIEIRSKDYAYSELSKQHNNKNKEAEESKKESLATISSLKEGHSEEIRRKDSNFAVLKDENGKLQRELSTSKSDISTVNSALRESYEQLNKQKEDYEQLLSDCGKLKDEWESSRRELSITNTSLKEARTRVEKLTNETELLRTEVSDNEIAIQQVNKNLQNSLQRQRELDTRIEQLNAEKNALEDSLSQAIARAEKMEKSASEAIQEKVQLERAIESLNTEIGSLNSDLAKAQSLQDTTIVEHVHVLEEAKRYTDRQLEEAKATIVQRDILIRKLEKTKSRMNSELEELKKASNPSFYPNGH